MSHNKNSLALQDPILQRFLECVKTGEFPSDFRIQIRIKDGSAHHRLDPEHSKPHDEILDLTGEDREKEMDFVQAIADGVNGLVLRSEACFMPGFSVGFLNIWFGFEHQEFLFNPDDDQFIPEDEELVFTRSPQLKIAMTKFHTVVDRIHPNKHT